MEELRPPRGLIAEIVTPLDPNGHLDTSGLMNHIRALTGYVHGIFLASPRVGEGLNLSALLRKDLLVTVLGLGNPDLSVLVWVTGRTEQDTSDTIKQLETVRQTIGGQSTVFWVDSPLFYHSNRGLPDLYSHFSSLSEAPFILMNDPELVGTIRKPLKRKNIRTYIFKELVLFPKITGMIFLGPLDRAYNYQKAARGRANFRFYDGDETRFLDYPSLSGVISAGANLAPEQWRRVCDSSLYLVNNHQSYPDSLKQMWETGQFLHKLREGYNEAPSKLIKQILYEKGVLEYPVMDFPEDLMKFKETIHELLKTSDTD